MAVWRKKNLKEISSSKPEKKAVWATVIIISNNDKNLESFLNYCTKRVSPNLSLKTKNSTRFITDIRWIKQDCNKTLLSTRFFSKYRSV